MSKIMSTNDFIPKGNTEINTSENGLWFTVTSSPPHNFRHKNVVTRSYLETEGVYRLPLRIDMKVTLDAPSFSVMLGETGRIHFCSTMCF